MLLCSNCVLIILSSYNSSNDPYNSCKQISLVFGLLQYPGCKSLLYMTPLLYCPLALPSHTWCLSLPLGVFAVTSGYHISHPHAVQGAVYTTGEAFTTKCSSAPRPFRQMDSLVVATSVAKTTPRTTPPSPAPPRPLCSSVLYKAPVCALNFIHCSQRSL